MSKRCLLNVGPRVWAVREDHMCLVGVACSASDCLPSNKKPETFQANIFQVAYYFESILDKKTNCKGEGHHQMN